MVDRQYGHEEYFFSSIRDKEKNLVRRGKYRRNYRVDVLTFSGDSRLRNVLEADTFLVRKKQAAEGVLFATFPALRAGRYDRQVLRDGLGLNNGLVTVSYNPNDSVVGTIGFTHDKTRNNLYLAAVGVARRHTGRHMSQLASEILIESLNPDVIQFVTVNPAMYKTGLQLASLYGYETFVGKDIDDETYNFLSEVIFMAQGDSADLLDKQSVLRGYYGILPQGSVPYEGDPFFTDTLKLAGGDAVSVVLVKKELDKAAYLQKLQP